MRVTEGIGGSTMRLDPIFPDWLGIASLCAVAALLAGSGAYRVLGSWGALALTAACSLLAVGTVVLGGVGSPVFVRITPHGVAVWRSWWDTESAAIRPLTPWQKLDEVVAIDDWLEVRGVAVTLRISTAGVGPGERQLLRDRLQDALERYRGVERGTDIDRQRMERLARRAMGSS